MKKQKKIKPKIKVNKLNSNPLFVKFLNWKGDKYTIENLLSSLKDSFESQIDKDIVQRKINNLDDFYLDNLSNFQKALTKHVQQFLGNYSISDLFLAWLSNSNNYIEEEIVKYMNDETRKISIKDPEGRWFEAAVCYNFIMTYNYFGGEIIKQCPMCTSYFAHKGKYARYCSDSCKELGIEKRKQANG